VSLALVGTWAFLMPRACPCCQRVSVAIVRIRSHRAPSELVRFPVVVFVVHGLPITLHSHDVGKHGAWSVVLVRVEEETKALEFVCVAEDIAGLRALLGEPHCEAIAVESTLAMDLELELYLGA
jgi:hypothetical protein